MRPVTTLNLFMYSLLLLLMCSCSTQNLFTASSPNTGKASLITDSIFIIGPDYEYSIRRDDKISISVWDHDELSVGSLYGIYNSNEVYGKWLQVNARGEINVPKVGPLVVKGLTILSLRDTLGKLYSAWIKNPIVDVKVLNKEISIIGEVKSPGKLLLEKDNNTLLDILARAGDFDFYANRRKITVLRMQGNTMHTLLVDLTRKDDIAACNIHILPGDVIYIPSRKGKDFEKRFSSVLPFASIITAMAIVYGTFF